MGGHGTNDHAREQGYEPPAPQAAEAAPEQAQQLPVGNQAMAEAAGRIGDGLLPGGAVHPSVVSAIGAARGGGHALPDAVRDQVAPHVGDPLSDVRIHSDARADQLSRSVAARAFTTGTDVFFAAGEYQPSSGAGMELLAHELTHVAQQRGVPTDGPMTVSEPGDAVEHEADEVARDATS